MKKPLFKSIRSQEKAMNIVFALAIGLLILFVLGYWNVIFAKQTVNTLNQCESKGNICATACPARYNQFTFLECTLPNQVCCLKTASAPESTVVEGDLHPK